MQRRYHRVLRCLASLLVLALASVSGEFVQASEAKPTTNAESPSTQQERPALEIVPKLSGVSATLQNGFGIFADIRNSSPKPVWLMPRWVTLTCPPELTPLEGSPSWYASLIGKATSQADGDLMPDNKKFDKLATVTLLGPGETVPATWTPTEDPCAEDPNYWRCRSKLLVEELGFVPGEYTMKIVVNYWRTKEDALAGNDNYQTQTAEIRVAVIAPQWIVIFGALLGAIGAYFVVPNVRSTKLGTGEKYWFKGFGQDAVGIASAILFAVIVTILLARLADTQFLIKVTVNDFWGAIAIGFLATATRKTILNKIAPTAEGPSEVKSEPQKT